MNFSGYVQLRRGLLFHLQDGRLSLLEYAVLITLIMLADKETGSGTINANTLSAFMGEGLDYESEVPRNRQRGKQRILKSLEEKRYIYRAIVPHSKRAYRFWVDKYLCTNGPNKSRRVDLSKVFVTHDLKDIRYAAAVAETVAEGVAETVASNKKEEKRHENTPSKPVNASLNASVSDGSEHSKSVAQTSGACALQGVHHSVLHLNASPVCVTSVRHVIDTQPRTDMAVRRIRIVPGAEPFHIDADTGQWLPTLEVNQLLRSGAAVEVS